MSIQSTRELTREEAIRKVKEKRLKLLAFSVLLDCMCRSKTRKDYKNSALDVDSLTNKELADELDEEFYNYVIND